MKANLVTTSHAPRPHLVPARGGANLMSKRIVWFLALAGGLAAGLPEVARAVNYTVTVSDPRETGTVSPSPGAHVYAGGTVVSIQATPAAGLQFDFWDWSGGVVVANSYSNATTMTVTGDGTLRAYFFSSAMYSATLVVCTPTNGTVSPDPGTHTYNPVGEGVWEYPTIVIEATPAPGYQFKRWQWSGSVMVTASTAARTTLNFPFDAWVSGNLCPEFEPISSASKVAVPNLVGLTQAQASAALTVAGLTLGTITQSQTQTLPAGQVISQNPAAAAQVALGSAVNLTVSTGSAPAGPIPGGPVAHWKLDETQGATAFDSAGGHGGALYGNPTWLPTGGRIGGALSFDGIDDHVNCGTFNPSAATGKLSVCIWARWNGQPRVWQGLIAKRNKWGDGKTMWSLEADINTGKLGFFHETSIRFGGDPVLPIGIWAHVAVTFDGRTATLYVNGEPTGSGPFSLPSDTQAPVVFGASEPDGANAFNGALDDVQLYDQALSQAQIQAVMTGAEAKPGADAAGLLAHWTLDETTGRVAADSAGTCDGVLIGGPVWQPTSGKVGGALKFDGLNDCVVTDVVLDPADGPFSVFAWVNGGAAGQVILSQDGSVGGTDWLAASATGRLATALGGGRSLTSTKIIIDGQWHEVGLTWDGTSRTLYVDGAAVATDKPAAPASSTEGLNIGTGKNLDAGTFWSGLIDDVRIYSGVVKP